MPLPLDAATRPRKPRNTNRVKRVFIGAKVEYRGMLRAVIAEMDLAAGTISVRLTGCRRRKVYQVTDLMNCKPSTPQLALPFEFPDR